MCGSGGADRPVVPLSWSPPRSSGEGAAGNCVVLQPFSWRARRCPPRSSCTDPKGSPWDEMSDEEEIDDGIVQSNEVAGTPRLEFPRSLAYRDVCAPVYRIAAADRRWLDAMMSQLLVMRSARAATHAYTVSGLADGVLSGTGQSARRTSDGVTQLRRLFGMPRRPIQALLKWPVDPAAVVWCPGNTATVVRHHHLTAVVQVTWQYPSPTPFSERDIACTVPIEVSDAPNASRWASPSPAMGGSPGGEDHPTRNSGTSWRNWGAARPLCGCCGEDEAGTNAASPLPIPDLEEDEELLLQRWRELHRHANERAPKEEKERRACWDAVIDCDQEEEVGRASSTVAFRGALTPSSTRSSSCWWSAAVHQEEEEKAAKLQPACALPKGTDGHSATEWCGTTQERGSSPKNRDALPLGRLRQMEERAGQEEVGNDIIPSATKTPPSPLLTPPPLPPPSSPSTARIVRACKRQRSTKGDGTPSPAVWEERHARLRAERELAALPSCAWSQLLPTRLCSGYRPLAPAAKQPSVTSTAPVSLSCSGHLPSVGFLTLEELRRGLCDTVFLADYTLSAATGAFLVAEDQLPLLADSAGDGDAKGSVRLRCAAEYQKARAVDGYVETARARHDSALLQRRQIFLHFVTRGVRRRCISRDVMACHTAAFSAAAVPMMGGSASQSAPSPLLGSAWKPSGTTPELASETLSTQWFAQIDKVRRAEADRLQWQRERVERAWQAEVHQLKAREGDADAVAMLDELHRRCIDKLTGVSVAVQRESRKGSGEANLSIVFPHGVEERVRGGATAVWEVDAVRISGLPACLRAAYPYPICEVWTQGSSGPRWAGAPLTRDSLRPSREFEGASEFVQLRSNEAMAISWLRNAVDPRWRGASWMPWDSWIAAVSRAAGVPLPLMLPRSATLTLMPEGSPLPRGRRAHRGMPEGLTNLPCRSPLEISEGSAALMKEGEDSGLTKEAEEFENSEEHAAPMLRDSCRLVLFGRHWLRGAATQALDFARWFYSAETSWQPNAQVCTAALAESQLSVLALQLSVSRLLDHGRFYHQRKRSRQESNDGDNNGCNCGREKRSCRHHTHIEGVAPCSECPPIGFFPSRFSSFPPPLEVVVHACSGMPSLNGGAVLTLPQTHLRSPQQLLLLASSEPCSPTEGSPPPTAMPSMVNGDTPLFSTMLPPMFPSASQNFPQAPSTAAERTSSSFSALLLSPQNDEAVLLAPHTATPCSPASRRVLYAWLEQRCRDAVGDRLRAFSLSSAQQDKPDTAVEDVRRSSSSAPVLSCLEAASAEQSCDLTAAAALSSPPPFAAWVDVARLHRLRQSLIAPPCPLQMTLFTTPPQQGRRGYRATPEAPTATLPSRRIGAAHASSPSPESRGSLTSFSLLYRGETLRRSLLDAVGATSLKRGFAIRRTMNVDAPPVEHWATTSGDATDKAGTPTNPACGPDGNGGAKASALLASTWHWTWFTLHNYAADALAKLTFPGVCAAPVLKSLRDAAASSRKRATTATDAERDPSVTGPTAPENNPAHLHYYEARHPLPSSHGSSRGISPSTTLAEHVRQRRAGRRALQRAFHRLLLTYDVLFLCESTSLPVRSNSTRNTEQEGVVSEKDIVGAMALSPFLLPVGTQRYSDVLSRDDDDELQKCVRSGLLYALSHRLAWCSTLNGPEGNTDFHNTWTSPCGSSLCIRASSPRTSFSPKWTACRCHPTRSRFGALMANGMRRDGWLMFHTLWLDVVSRYVAALPPSPLAWPLRFLGATKGSQNFMNYDDDTAAVVTCSTVSASRGYERLADAVSESKASEVRWATPRLGELLSGSAYEMLWYVDSSTSEEESLADETEEETEGIWVERDAEAAQRIRCCCSHAALLFSTVETSAVLHSVLSFAESDDRDAAGAKHIGGATRTLRKTPPTLPQPLPPLCPAWWRVAHMTPTKRAEGAPDGDEKDRPRAQARAVEGAIRHLFRFSLLCGALLGTRKLLVCGGPEERLSPSTPPPSSQMVFQTTTELDRAEADEVYERCPCGGPEDADAGDAHERQLLFCQRLRRYVARLLSGAQPPHSCGDTSSSSGPPHPPATPLSAEEEEQDMETEVRPLRRLRYTRHVYPPHEEVASIVQWLLPLWWERQRRALVELQLQGPLLGPSSDSVDADTEAEGLRRASAAESFQDDEEETEEKANFSSLLYWLSTPAREAEAWLRLLSYAHLRQIRQPCGPLFPHTPPFQLFLHTTLVADAEVHDTYASMLQRYRLAEEGEG